jgi:predicted RNase H-like nuclease (RuvC/YqgF family)
MNEQGVSRIGWWRQELQSLQQQLSIQATTAAWPTLQRTDAMLAARLRQLQAEPELKAQLAKELQQLQSRHQQVLQLCQQQREQLQQEMARFNAGLEGARAYEESQAWQ